MNENLLDFSLINSLVEDSEQLNSQDLSTPLEQIAIKAGSEEKNTNDSLLALSLQLLRQQLTSFANAPDFQNKMQLAFGKEIDFLTLREAWKKGDFIPTFKSSERLGMITKTIKNLYVWST